MGWKHFVQLAEKNLLQEAFSYIACGILHLVRLYTSGK